MIDGFAAKVPKKLFFIFAKSTKGIERLLKFLNLSLNPLRGSRSLSIHFPRLHRGLFIFKSFGLFGSQTLKWVLFEYPPAGGGTHREWNT
jgi:hypothetical protein